MAGALADPRRAAPGARAVALESRPLVGGDRRDVEVVAQQFVVVLGVGDGGLEQLAPVARHGARRVGEDRARVLHRLAADVIADQARLARRRADVLGLGADDDALARRLRLAARGGGSGLLLLGGATAAQAPAACGGSSRLLRLLLLLELLVLVLVLVVLGRGLVGGLLVLGRRLELVLVGGLVLVSLLGDDVGVLLGSRLRGRLVRLG